MPRSRVFKPEHRQHRKVGPLSDAEYRLWCSMILEADDAGRFVCDANQLRVQTWGYHPAVKVKTVETAIRRIDGLGLIHTYEIDGVRYAFFPSWSDHQKPKYPTPSKLPPPILPQDSPNPPPGLREDSGSPPPRIVLSSASVGVGEGLSRNRVGEGRGRGGEPLTTTPSSSLSSSETVKILEAQHNGTITSDEARARLAALGKVKP
jgi:hypothetical protein